MTTDVEIIIAPDISVANEVVGSCFLQQEFKLKLSAASFLVQGFSNSSLICVLGFIFDLVEEKLPEYDVWLFVGHSAWQPDSRVVRYRKLWGALKARGFEVLGGGASYEAAIEVEGKIKFFGALCISRFSTSSAVSLIVGERCSYVVALPRNFEVKSIVGLGWTGVIDKDFDFIFRVLEAGGVIFNRVGEFDDSDRGFVSIGSTKLIEELLG